MPLSALGLALVAACLHACWNLLLARERDTAATTAVSLVVFVLVLAPIAAATWRIERGAVPAARDARPGNRLSARRRPRARARGGAARRRGDRGGVGGHVSAHPPGAEARERAGGFGRSRDERRHRRGARAGRARGAG